MFYEYLTLFTFLATLYISWTGTSNFFELYDESIDLKYPMNPPVGFTTMMLRWASTKFIFKYIIFLVLAFLLIIGAEIIWGTYSIMFDEEQFHWGMGVAIVIISLGISSPLLFLLIFWFCWVLFWWFSWKYMITDYACPHCLDTSMMWGMDEYDTFCKNCNIHTKPILWKK